MIDGGKRAGDQDLKERRKRRKKAAENRINLLGEALRGHVDDEDGVLLKVYDDIQEELKVKTDVLKKAKQKVRLPHRMCMLCCRLSISYCKFFETNRV